MTVIIVGAGIGGLTAALSLHQIGIGCRIYEAVGQLQPLGVGINLLPHAVRELSELDLQPALAQRAIETAELAYFSKHGRLIWREPRGRSAGYRWPQYSVHRGQLQMLLYAAVRERLGPDAVCTGHRLVHVESLQDRVSVSFDTGDAERTTVTGELLIGADGIHSSVRAQLYPVEGAPVWNGAVLWRGVTETTPFLDGRSMIMAGHQTQKFVAYPISSPHARRGEALVNWIAELRHETDRPWRREDWNRPGVLDDFLPVFADWVFAWLDIPRLIRSARAVYEYPMVDRDPLPGWTHGRVSLLGDAAHPMYPIGSNGASQAILDARVLARELKRSGPQPAALADYEAERRPVTTEVVLANRGNGPEQVMQLVEQRAPQGFARIEDVLSRDELETTAARYKRLAGFDPETLNRRASIVDLTPAANEQVRTDLLDTP